jgi:hypothetical protein
MFLEQFLYSPVTYPMDMPGDQPNLRGQALKLYSDTLSKGKWNRAVRLLNRKPKKLLDLQSFKSSDCAMNRHFVGIQSVSIERIQGSEGRMEDFDNSFNPIHERSRSRWLSVASVRLAGAALPPVELIQVGGIYFVRDGHHRISVAKALGEQYIDAEVTLETC